MGTYKYKYEWRTESIKNILMQVNHSISLKETFKHINSTFINKYLSCFATVKISVQGYKTRLLPLNSSLIH